LKMTSEIRIRRREAKRRNLGVGKSILERRQFHGIPYIPLPRRREKKKIEVGKKKKRTTTFFVAQGGKKGDLRTLIVYCQFKGRKRNKREKGGKFRARSP